MTLFFAQTTSTIQTVKVVALPHVQLLPSSYDNFLFLTLTAGFLFGWYLFSPLDV